MFLINERGNRLLQYCVENDIRILQGLFLWLSEHTGSRYLKNTQRLGSQLETSLPHSVMNTRGTAGHSYHESGNVQNPPQLDLNFYSF